MKIFWIACKEMPGFYSQVCVLWCQKSVKGQVIQSQDAYMCPMILSLGLFLKLDS